MTICVSLAGLLAAVPLAGQFGPLTDEFLLSGPFSDFTADPVVAPLPDGRFLVAWERFNVELDDSSILGRVVSPEGVPEPEVRVLVPEPFGGRVSAPALGGRVLGDVALSWVESSATSCAVRGQRLSQNDLSVEVELAPATFDTALTPCPVGLPQVAPGPDSSIAQLLPTGTGPESQVRFTIFDEAGRGGPTFLLRPIEATTNLPGRRSDADLTSARDFAVATWMEANGAQSNGIYSLWVDLDTAQKRSGILVQREIVPGSLGPPKVAMGSFLTIYMVVWADLRSPGALMASILTGGGTVRAARFPVRETEGHPIVAYDVAADSRGRFVVVWSERESQEAFAPVNLFARFFSSVGTPLSDAVQVNQTPAADTAPAIALATDGTLLVTWNRGPGTLEPGVYGRLLQIAPVTTTCKAGGPVLCLQGGRFRAEVEWRDFAGNTGLGRVVPTLTNESGLFWFFNPPNWELMVKVLDGCALTGHHWVFSAATTNVEYTLTVTDTFSGEVRTYQNPLGVSAPAVTDTTAFSTCP
jgi:hypothetical protein